MLLLLGAFLAGIVTVFAPCVLPLLPIIIGGSIKGGEKDPKRPYIVAGSLAVSLIIFTLLLKATTLLINIPPATITYVSGGIIIVIGLLSLFPAVYEKLITKLGIQSRSQRLLGKGTKKQDTIGAIITGAALGPVFSSCSPVYAYILATILPANFFQAMAYIVSYVIGLSIMMLLIGILGQRFVSRIRFASNPKGWFQRGVAILFIVVGLLVFTGYDKRLQTWVSNHTPFDFDGLSSKLIPSSDRVSREGVLNVEPYAAPELSDDLQDWINSEPLKLADLRGKVVLIDFWTYSCINCIRTQPYLKGWHNTYKDSGLVIIGVHAPEFSFEQVPANVEKAVRDAGLEYPVALDNNFSTWNAFENQYWPGNYLIDKDGQVRRVHSGEGEYKETEEAIRVLLQEQGGSVPSESFVDDLAEVPVTEMQSPETYLGARRAVNYGGSEPLIMDKTQLFSFPAELEKDHWAIDGTWRVSRETITAQGDSKLRFNVSGKEVYLVAGANAPKSIKVAVDGSVIDASSGAGADVDQGSVTVQEYKLYRIIDFGSFQPGKTLEFTVPDGVELNVFTFGS